MNPPGPRPSGNPSELEHAAAALKAKAGSLRDIAGDSRGLSHGTWFEGPGRGAYDHVVTSTATSLSHAAEGLEDAGSALQKKAVVLRAEQVAWAVADTAYRAFRAAQELL